MEAVVVEHNFLMLMVPILVCFTLVKLAGSILNVHKGTIDMTDTVHVAARGYP